MIYHVDTVSIDISIDIDVNINFGTSLIAGLLVAADDPCNACMQAKHARNPFPASSSFTSKPLALIHTYAIGRMPCESIGGSAYIHLLPHNNDNVGTSGGLAAPAGTLNEAPTVAHIFWDPRCDPDHTCITVFSYLGASS
jgi:hypothetical protein